MLQFSSEIFIIGVNPYVPVPEKILQSLFKDAKKDGGPIAVKGTLNGKPFIQTVVKFSGVWRLYLNGVMLKGAGLKVRDIARIEIAYDPLSREEKMPERLLALLKKDKKAAEAFEKFAPYRKKEILRYLNNLKGEETRDRNIEKVMKSLNGEKVQGLLALTYRKNK